MIQVVLFIFHFMQLYIFLSLSMLWYIANNNIDQSIYKGKNYMGFIYKYTRDLI